MFLLKSRLTKQIKLHHFPIDVDKQTLTNTPALYAQFRPTDTNEVMLLTLHIWLQYMLHCNAWLYAQHNRKYCKHNGSKYMRIHTHTHFADLREYVCCSNKTDPNVQHQHAESRTELVVSSTTTAHTYEADGTYICGALGADIGAQQGGDVECVLGCCVRSVCWSIKDEICMFVFLSSWCSCLCSHWIQPNRVWAVHKNTYCEGCRREAGS